jgi:hypothetical protein
MATVGAQVQATHNRQSHHGPAPSLWGGVCIVAAICVLAAVLSFPAGW